MVKEPRAKNTKGPTKRKKKAKKKLLKRKKEAQKKLMKEKKQAAIERKAQKKQAKQLKQDADVSMPQPENGALQQQQQQKKKRKAMDAVQQPPPPQQANGAKPSGPPPAEADPHEEPATQQKKKKKKKGQQAAEPQAEAVQPSISAAAVHAEPDPNAAQPVGPATAEADPHEKAATQKKQKKKKTRLSAAEPQAEAEQPSTIAAAVHAEPDAHAAPPPRKQQKKLQQEGSQGARAAVLASMAEVGDKQAAQSGRPIQKAIYTEHAAVAALSDAEVAAWRSERSTVVDGCDLRPVPDFEHAGFSPDLLHATRSFVSPSPIQAQCWPILQAGRDLVGIAATGSGKTLAFGLPALKHILAQRKTGVFKGKGPAALMLAPTRELAAQIAAVLEEAGAKVGLKTLCVYGGVPKGPQAQALRKGVEIVVATPGRLEDLLQDGACRLGAVTFLVLDEADRMLDLGFEPHIRAITNQIRSDRQTAMFSATWPSAIQKLASEFLACPHARVTIGSADLSASHSVRQVVEVIDPAARDRRLDELLRQHHGGQKNRVLVFVLYKKEAARVEAMLQRKSWNCAAVHGDISQAQRTAAVDGFKSGKVPLLIATDVAARGLDIPDVAAVINYSFPLTTEDYVHRIGRTGRAGKTGMSHTFFSGQSDKPRAGELINVLREAGQDVPPELLAFGTTVKKKESKLYGAHFKEVDHTKKATKVSFDSDDDE